MHDLAEHAKVRYETGLFSVKTADETKIIYDDRIRDSKLDPDKAEQFASAWYLIKAKDDVEFYWNKSRTPDDYVRIPNYPNGTVSRWHYKEDIEYLDWQKRIVQYRYDAQRELHKDSRIILDSI